MSSLLTTMAESIGLPAATSSSLMAEQLADQRAEVRVGHVDAEHPRELAVMDELAGARSANESLVDRLVLHGPLSPSCRASCRIGQPHVTRQTLGFRALATTVDVANRGSDCPG